MKNTVLKSLLIFFVLICACSKKEISYPDKIGNKAFNSALKGDQAIQEINKLHGLEVASAQNLIAYYGDSELDQLYLTSFGGEDEAQESLNKMISKMSHTQEGPFFHVMPVDKYDKKVFMTLGMGSIHYIYRSGENIIWLQTNQAFGRQLPEDLEKMHPVS